MASPRTNWLGTLLLTLGASLLASCSSTRVDLAAWRASQVAAPLVAPDVASELDALERRRNERDLRGARQLALALAAAVPGDARVLSAASRAESDAMTFFSAEDRKARDHAAASALDYAERAEAAGASSAAALGQLAWALGTTTHLQPMFERAGHASRTVRAAERALEADAEQTTAHATLALVHLRLETLPWIASVMAFGAPKSSLKEAEQHARRACELEPSRENRQILAKVLIARGQRDQARALLDLALAAPAQHPRDDALEPALRTLRRSLD